MSLDFRSPPRNPTYVCLLSGLLSQCPRRLFQTFSLSLNIPHSCCLAPQLIEKIEIIRLVLFSVLTSKPENQFLSVSLLAFFCILSMTEQPLLLWKVNASTCPFCLLNDFTPQVIFILLYWIIPIIMQRGSNICLFKKRPSQTPLDSLANTFSLFIISMLNFSKKLLEFTIFTFSSPVHSSTHFNLASVYITKWKLLLTRLQKSLMPHPIGISPYLTFFYLIFPQPLTQLITPSVLKHSPLLASVIYHTALVLLLSHWLHLFSLLQWFLMSPVSKYWHPPGLFLWLSSLLCLHPLPRWSHPMALNTTYAQD